MAFTRNKIADSNRAFIYARTSSGVDYSTLIGYCGADKSDIVVPASKNGVALKSINGAFKYPNLSGTLTIPDSVIYR